MENNNILVTIIDMGVAVLIGIVGSLSAIPWVQIGTFCMLCLNGAYVAYKWRKSIQFNAIALRSAQIDLEIKEAELLKLKIA